MDYKEKSNYFYNYFKSKFSYHECDDSEIDDFLSCLPKLNPGKFLLLQNEVTEKEIVRAISELKKQTSPGLDGMTSEFLQIFAKPITKIFKWLWSEIILQDEIPMSLRGGLISLIYKKNDPLNLDNWRPIIMSNPDYKLFSTIIKYRLALVLPELIGEYQTCNIWNRSIYDNIFFLDQNINTNNESDGARLALDQESAYDYISLGLVLVQFPWRIYKLYKNFV